MKKRAYYTTSETGLSVRTGTICFILRVCNEPMLSFLNEVRTQKGNTVYEQILQYVYNTGGHLKSTYTLAELDIYGSKRIGLLLENLPLVTREFDGNITGRVISITNLYTDIRAAMPTTNYSRTLGKKRYEMTNHLGNVLATISDRKLPVDDNADNTIDYYTADAITAQMYYAFGAPLEGKTWTVTGGEGYRYGFNGKEDDKETDFQDYGMRMYYPILGRFFSEDPLTKKYPELSPYQFGSDRPIDGIDLDGLEWDYSCYLWHDAGISQATAQSVEGQVNAKIEEYALSQDPKYGHFGTGLANFSFGLVGSVCAFFYCETGVGSAAGGAIALTASLGETAIGCAQMAAAFTAKPENRSTQVLYENQTLGGIAASAAKCPYAPQVDAYCGLIPAIFTGGFTYKSSFGLMPDLDNAAKLAVPLRKPFVLIGQADAILDNYGALVATKDLTIDAYDFTKKKPAEAKPIPAFNNQSNSQGPKLISETVSGE